MTEQSASNAGGVARGRALYDATHRKQRRHDDTDDVKTGSAHTKVDPLMVTPGPQGTDA